MSPEPVGQIPNQEDARIQLAIRCNEALGGNYDVLAQVVSYFPDIAERFIQIQDYAASIEGERSAWKIVMHRKDGFGLN